MNCGFDMIQTSILESMRCKENTIGTQMLPSFHLSAFDIYCAITQYIDYCNRHKAVMSFHSIIIYHTTTLCVYKILGTTKNTLYLVFILLSLLLYFVL